MEFILSYTIYIWPIETCFSIVEDVFVLSYKLWATRLFRVVLPPDIRHQSLQLCCREPLLNSEIIFTVGQRKKVTAVTFFLARPRSDQRGTNTDQIRKVNVWCIEWKRLDLSWVPTMGSYYAWFGFWQFKVLAGKEVTALPATRGEGGYWRWERMLLYLCWNWIALSF